MKKNLFFLLNIILVLSSCFPRQGNKIYSALFGETKYIYEVIHSQDQTNLLDCCIWLHVKAEKEEIIRIARLKEQSSIPIKNEIFIPKAGEGEVPEWFLPTDLEEGFKVSFFLDEAQQNEQTYYISKDTTEVYIRDSVI